MKTILVPTDFSKNADNAFKYAVNIAKEIKANIILLHAYESPVLYSDVHFADIHLDYKMLHDTAVKKMNTYFKKNDALIGDLNVDLIIQQGLASARIIEIALEKKVELIVMGTTGATAMERVLLGSNAGRVIKNAPCMVLAIPSKAKFNGISKVVYTTDLSDDSLFHSNAAISFAKKFNAELLFLKVDNVFKGEDVEIHQMNKRIKQFVKYPKMSGFVCADINVTDGINYFIREHKVDVLAMYTHHRNLFQTLFQSSITKKISKHTDIPLLVIHQKD